MISACNKLQEVRDIGNLGTRLGELITTGGSLGSSNGAMRDRFQTEMNEILKNTHIFVEVLRMARCNAVQQWDEEAFKKAQKWANYFEEV